MFYNLDESKDANLQKRKTDDKKLDLVVETVNKLLDGDPAEFKIEKIGRFSFQS